MHTKLFRRFYSTPIGNYHSTQMELLYIKKNKNSKETNDEYKVKKGSSYIHMYHALIDKYKLSKD